MEDQKKTRWQKFRRELVWGNLGIAVSYTLITLMLAGAIGAFAYGDYVTGGLALVAAGAVTVERYSLRRNLGIRWRRKKKP